MHEEDDRKARIAVVAVAVVGFVVSCLFGPGGLLTTWHAADVSYYGQLGAHLRAGEIPYRDLYVEYPPGALPIFLIPAVSEAHYVDLFKILMTMFGAAAIVMTAVAATALDVSVRRLALAVAPLAAAPILLGSVFLNRFDPWPMLLTIAGLAALLRSRPVAGAISLALSVVTKVFAAAALPVVAVYLVRTARGTVRRAAVAFAAVLAIALLPFALAGPGGLAFSFYIQLTRHLEIESLAASFLLVADRLGLYDARIVDGKPGAGRPRRDTSDRAWRCERDRCGRRSDRVGGVVREGRAVPARFVAAFAAALVGYVAFGKVLSPQYLVWLLPIVPLVGGRRGIVATGLLVVSLVLTRREFSAFDSLSTGGSGVWLLIARNLVLVGLFVTLAIEVRRSSSVTAA